MTQVILLRHGLVDNPKKVIYGALPGYGLDEAGKADLVAAAKHLSEYPLAQIVVSPLQRAQETLAVLQANGLANVPVTTDERLTEWRYVWEGLTYPELEERYPELFEQYKTDPFLLPKEVDGQEYETFAEIEARVAAVVDELVSKYPDQIVLLISHGDPIITTMAHYLEQSFWAVKGGEYPRVAEARTLQFDGDTVRIHEWPEKL